MVASCGPTVAPLLFACVPRPQQTLSLAAADTCCRQRCQKLSLVHMTAYDPYFKMKRADLPLEEEVRALQVVGGCLGAVLGGFLIRSSLVGAAVGTLGGRAVAFEPGRRGALARELGWQLAEQTQTRRRQLKEVLVNMKAEARQLGLPEARDVLIVVRHVVERILVELRAADQAAPADSRRACPKRGRTTGAIAGPPASRVFPISKVVFPHPRRRRSTRAPGPDEASRKAGNAVPLGSTPTASPLACSERGARRARRAGSPI